MEETPPPSKISVKNSWPVREDHSISSGGSRGWPDWNARESLKCKDSSEWPSWECSKGNKDIQKGDTIGTKVLTVADSSFDEQRYGWPSWECSKGNKDIQKGDTIGTEVLTVADSSFDEQRGRGRFRESSRDRGWNGSSKRHSEMSKRNSWHATKDHSRSRNGHSRRCPDWDAHNSSKCKDDSGWSSWQSSQVNKDTHNDDTIDREVHTVSNYTSDEQRGQSKIRKRGWSRTGQREYSNSWSPSPCNGLKKASCSLIEKGSVSEMTSRQCRDFAAGKCFRASQCKFLHQDACNSSKCKDDSGWPSWEFSQEKKDTHNDDTIDRDVHAVSNYTSDEQRGQSKIWKRSRSRSRRRKYSKSRSRSPCNGLRQASCRLIEKGSVSEMTSRRCSDFAAGNCFRGFQSRFLHQGYLKSRDGDHSRNDLTERSKFRADDRGALQFGDYKGYASDYCDEVESRKNTLCWKKLLEGKSFREESCRYSHNKSVGEEYDSRNERVIYDQNVKPLINQNDIGHCKYFSIGRCHQNDCRFSHDVGRVTTDFLDAANTNEYDEDCSLDRPKAKISGRGEGEIKSEKGSAWDKFAGVSEKPKDATGWGKWPSKPDNYTGNSNSHDSQSKRWDGRSKGNICSQDLSEVMKQIDNNILRNSVKKYGERNDSGSNGKLSERDKLIDLNMLADREKAIGQGKDKTKSWNGPTRGKDCFLDRLKSLNAKLSGWEEDTKKSENDSTWDKFAGVLERPKDTASRDNWPAWPDSSNWKSNSHYPQSKLRDGISKGNIYSQEPIDAKKKADNNILYNTVKKSSERADPGRNDKFSERKEFLQSHLRNGAANINMDLKMSVNKEKAAGQDKDMTKLWNGPTWGDEGCYLDRSKETGRDGRTISNRDPRVFVDIEKHNDGNIAHNIVHKDTTKSWNSPTWGGEWCSLDRPKATGKGDRAISNRDPRICADVEERNDGNISYSFVEKGIQKSGSEWTKKVTVRDANKLSTLQNDYNGAGTSTIEVSDSVRLNNGKKSTNQGEDKKNSWNPSCNDSACSLDNTKASGWGGSRPSNDRHCHDSIDVEKSSQNNLVKTYCEMAISGQDNKVVGKDKYLPSHILNGWEGADQGTGNLLASKKIFYRKENQIEAQGSPGGFIFPPSSLLGFSQSCPALSTNPSNGVNVILDESVKYKLSALVNQMQNQYEEALKILETWARQNSITADQALQLSKLQACLSLISENGQQNTPANTSEVHSKSNEVLEKLKMEYLESSATILKQQEPVGYTEVNPETVMVEKVNGSYSKGEQCKKEEEIIQSVGVDARCEAGESKQDEKSTWLFRNALVKLVKEILYPIWMEGQFKKKEDHNTIVKKVVDKVISTEGVNIPRTPEHTEQYLSLSKPRISALINDYVVYIKKLADSS